MTPIPIDIQPNPRRNHHGHHTALSHFQLQARTTQGEHQLVLSIYLIEQVGTCTVDQVQAVGMHYAGCR